MNTRPLLAVIAISAAGMAAPALAADSNFYMVAGIGRSSIDVDPNSINFFATANGLASSVTVPSSNSFGWKLQLGFQFNKYVALEGGYEGLGKASYFNINNVYTAQGEKRAALVNLDLVGKFPLGDSFSLLGRLGMFEWETRSDLPTAVSLIGKTENGFDWKFGAGVQYDFTNAFSLRGEFERFNGVGKPQTAGDSKVNLFTLGAVLKF